MSIFDPELFKTTQTTESNATVQEPVPEDDLYSAIVSKIDVRVTQNGSPVMDVNWKLDCPEIEVAHERIARQSVWLDITEEGSLDHGKGKNVQLGQLREAVGQNQAGELWAPNMLEGAVAMVKVANRMSDDGRQFVDVKKVVAL